MIICLRYDTLLALYLFYPHCICCIRNCMKFCMKIVLGNPSWGGDPKYSIYLKKIPLQPKSTLNDQNALTTSLLHHEPTLVEATNLHPFSSGRLPLHLKNLPKSNKKATTPVTHPKSPKYSHQQPLRPSSPSSAGGTGWLLQHEADKLHVIFLKKKINDGLFGKEKHQEPYCCIAAGITGVLQEIFNSIWKNMQHIRPSYVER